LNHIKEVIRGESLRKLKLTIREVSMEIAMKLSEIEQNFNEFTTKLEQIKIYEDKGSHFK
jgi:hypothetical protein